LPNKRLLLAPVLALALAGCRRDMQMQPRYDPMSSSDFFGDGRSARPEIPGTVARGHLRIDTALYTGKVNDQLIDYFPIPIARADLERGRDRFNIYCSPCHGLTGDGRGMVVLRGFRQPPSYHVERLIKIQVGHFFDVMTNGYGAMPSYASRVPVDDRWRIAAYIRVLQFSQNAPLDDVPANMRTQLDHNPVSPPAIDTTSLPTGDLPAEIQQ